MKHIDIPMLLLAILVIAMFSLAGIAIHYANLWLLGLFVFLGFVLMAFGIRIKRMRESEKQ